MSARQPFLPSRPASRAVNPPSETARPRSSGKLDGVHPSSYATHSSDENKTALGSGPMRALNLTGLRKTRPSAVGMSSMNRSSAEDLPARAHTPSHWTAQEATEGSQTQVASRPTSLRPSSPFVSREVGNVTASNFSFKTPAIPLAKSSTAPSSFAPGDNIDAHIVSFDMLPRSTRDRALGHGPTNPTGRLSLDSFAPSRLRQSSMSLESIQEAEDSGYFSAQNELKSPDENVPYEHFVPLRSSSNTKPPGGSTADQPELKHPSPKRPSEMLDSGAEDLAMESERKRFRTASPSGHAGDNAHYSPAFSYPSETAPSARFQSDADEAMVHASFSRRENARDAYMQAPTFFNKKLPATLPQSKPSASTSGGIPGLELTEADMTRFVGLYENARKKWTEGTLEEWHAGADEITAKFGRMMNMVKEHMTEKMSLYSALHSRLANHRSTLNSRAETLQNARQSLMRDSTNVVG